eukprot:XP_001704759.1 Hypothetical protein GL50803_31847 [Giardia lamblia ATCC 50803]
MPCRPRPVLHLFSNFCSYIYFRDAQFREIKGWRRCKILHLLVFNFRHTCFLKGLRRWERCHPLMPWTSCLLILMALVPTLWR